MGPRSRVQGVIASKHVADSVGVIRAEGDAHL